MIDLHTRYGQRSNRELEALWALETSIASVAARFNGEDAFNYSQEVEIAAHLMMEVREAFGVTEQVGNLPVHLTRMEWRCLPNRSTDLVLVRPEAARRFRGDWGKKTWGKIAKILPLLAAIEIKRGGGNVTTPALVRKDLQDLDAIADSDSLGHPVTYFLCWVDSSLRTRPHQNQRYLQVKDELEEWCNESPERRRAFLLSRDRVGFAYPTYSWLAQPIPPGTVEFPCAN